MISKLKEQVSSCTIAVKYICHPTNISSHRDKMGCMCEFQTEAKILYYSV